MALHYLYYAIKQDGRAKVGASSNPNGRKRGCKYQEIILLEAYDCPIKCGDREIDLQLKYFGKRDSRSHYAVLQTKEYKTKISESTKSRWKNHREVMMNSRARGSNHYLSKLTEEDVSFIRKVYYKFYNKLTPMPKGKMSSKQLVDKFNCTIDTISKIVNGKTWKHIK